jgi:myo-inositol-1-phosphate synthase
VGDDVKSQFGATITHRVLMKLAQSRGMKIDASYQLNVGGNMDFLNMLERGRLKSKVEEQENVKDRGGDEPGADGRGEYPHRAIGLHSVFDGQEGLLRADEHAGLREPADGTRHEAARRGFAEFRWGGGGRGALVRCLALARREKIAGPLHEVCAALMKRPPRQMTDEEAAAAMDAWIERVG